RYAGLSQPFEWSEKRAARQRVAQAGVTSAFAGLEEVRLNLVADVKVAFYELLVALRDLDLARQNQNIVEEVGRAVKTRVLSGEAPEFEAIKADVEVMKANQVVTRAQNVVRIRRVTLDTLTANALGDNYAIRGGFRVYPRELSLNALTARALDRHPTIRRLLSRVERTRHQIVFEQEARIPNVTVTGQYQRDAGREAWVAALSIPIPIWYQRQGEILAAMGLKRQEEAELLRTRNDIARAVTQHFQEAQTANQQITLFEKGLIALAEEALRIAQFSFRQGAASLLEVLDAQRVFRDTQLNYAHARFDLSLALVRLERTVGGEL
ncbi:MAG: TolC family protein, partial [Nitrospirales bacterium]